VVRLAPLLALAVCLVLSACAATPGKRAAQAACDAYGNTAVKGDAPRAAAQKDADLAAASDPSWAALQRDIRAFYAHADANTAAQNAGRTVTAQQSDAYFAADKRVRADCASAGRDLGPLKP
jgi:hypothetical protein